MCADGYMAHIGGNPPMTFADHEQFAKAFYTAFPDLNHTLEEAIADDDNVAFRFTLRGTHRADFMGIPPTNRPFEAWGVGIFRVVDGKVAEVHGVFDQFAMMKQLGVVQ